MVSADIGRYLAGAREEHHACIVACLECIAACRASSGACRDDASVQSLSRCIRLDRDCAEACALVVRVLSGGSDSFAEVCRMAARLADACADECERHAERDHCRACADACRRCAAECRRWSAEPRRLAA